MSHLHNHKLNSLLLFSFHNWRSASLSIRNTKRGKKMRREGRRLSSGERRREEEKREERREEERGERRKEEEIGGE